MVFVFIYCSVFFKCITYYIIYYFIVIDGSSSAPSKVARRGQRTSASMVPGTASAELTNRPPIKKRSRKDSTSDDDSAGERKVTIQMQHTINTSRQEDPSLSGLDTAVRSLHDEMKSRRDMILSLQEMGGILVDDEITEHKMRILEVNYIYLCPIYVLFISIFWLLW